MKTVTENLAGTQIFFFLSFEVQDVFIEYLIEEHRSFLTMLSVIEEHIQQFERSDKDAGCW